LPPVDSFTHTVETLRAEIGRIVAERQDLRAAGAEAPQSQLSQLLIQRHLGEPARA
jgi:hypothetical protein